MASFPEAPPNLKTIQPYLKIAQEHDQRDFVVAYWARVYSLQLGIKASKQPDEKAFLLTLMDWLESVKKANRETSPLAMIQLHKPIWRTTPISFSRTLINKIDPATLARMLSRHSTRLQCSTT